MNTSLSSERPSIPQSIDEEFLNTANSSLLLSIESFPDVSPFPSPERLLPIPGNYVAFLEIFQSSFSTAFKSVNQINNFLLTQYVRGFVGDNEFFKDLALELSKIYHQPTDKRLMLLYKLKPIFVSLLRSIRFDSVQDELGFFKTNANPLLTFDNYRFTRIMETLNTFKKHPLRSDISNVFRQHLDLPLDPWQIDDLFIRRMDSLARLLTLQRDLSACAAVTIHDNIVYLASNNAGVSESMIIFFLYQRMLFIREFLKQMLSSNTIDSLYFPEMRKYQPLYLEQLRAFVAGLTSMGGTIFPHSVLYQAITKLLISLYPQPDGLPSVPEYFKDALIRSTPIVVMTPSMLPGSQLVHLSWTIFTDSAHDHLTTPQLFSYYPLRLKTSHHINDFHCEQLIYFYLLLNSLISTPVPPLSFGISRLCCQICYEVFSSVPEFSIRGSHHTKKASVAKIITEGQTFDPSFLVQLNVLFLEPGKREDNKKRARDFTEEDNYTVVAPTTPTKTGAVQTISSSSPLFSPDTALKLETHRLKNQQTPPFPSFGR